MSSPPTLNNLCRRAVVKFMLSGINLALGCCKQEAMILLGQVVLKHLKIESKNCIKRKGMRSRRRFLAQLGLKFPLDCLACAYVSEPQSFSKLFELNLSYKKRELEQEEQMSYILELLTLRGYQEESQPEHYPDTIDFSLDRENRLYRRVSSTDEWIAQEYEKKGLNYDERIDKWIHPKHSQLLDQFTVNDPSAWYRVWNDLVKSKEIDFSTDVKQEKNKIVQVEVTKEEYERIEKHKRDLQRQRDEVKRKERLVQLRQERKGSYVRKK